MEHSVPLPDSTKLERGSRILLRYGEGHARAPTDCSSSRQSIAEPTSNARGSRPVERIVGSSGQPAAFAFTVPERAFAAAGPDVVSTTPRPPPAHAKPCAM